MFISNTTSANIVISFDRVEVKKANEILALGLKIITFFNLLFRKLLIEKKKSNYSNIFLWKKITFDVRTTSILSGIQPRPSNVFFRVGTFLFAYYYDKK